MVRTGLGVQMVASEAAGKAGGWAVGLAGRWTDGRVGGFGRPAGGWAGGVGEPVLGEFADADRTGGFPRVRARGSVGHQVGGQAHVPCFCLLKI